MPNTASADPADSTLTSMTVLHERLIVTIDGPAGTGKSSVARLLAARLGLEFLDTGAMYRAAAALAIDARIDLEPLARVESEIAGLVLEADLRFDFQDDPPSLLAGGESIMHRVRDADVGALVSPISGLAQVRRILVERQRRIGEAHPRLVTEGRDQGSVVFPNANVKIYLDAGLEVRARRRAEQLAAGSAPVSLDVIRAEIADRDQRDASRPVGPLRCPEGAERVDTSELAQDEVIDRLAQIVSDRVGSLVGRP